MVCCWSAYSLLPLEQAVQLRPAGRAYPCRKRDVSECSCRMLVRWYSVNPSRRLAKHGRPASRAPSCFPAASNTPAGQRTTRVKAYSCLPHTCEAGMAPSRTERERASAQCPPNIVLQVGSRNKRVYCISSALQPRGCGGQSNRLDAHVSQISSISMYHNNDYTDGTALFVGRESLSSAHKYSFCDWVVNG